MTATRKEKQTIASMLAIVTAVCTIGSNLLWKVYDRGARDAEDRNDRREIHRVIEEAGGRLARVEDSTRTYHDHFSEMYSWMAYEPKRRPAEQSHEQHIGLMK